MLSDINVPKTSKCDLKIEFWIVIILSQGKRFGKYLFKYSIHRTLFTGPYYKIRFFALWYYLDITDVCIHRGD